jgi:hypothetical protein
LTDEHIFLKHAIDSEWDILSLKETGTAATMKGTYLKNFNSDIHEIIANTKKNKLFIGIKAKHFERVRGI